MTSAESLLLNKVLNDALERKARDVHLTVGNYPVMRVGGGLVTMTQEQVLTPDFINRVLESFISETDRELLSERREMTVVYNWADRARFRAQVFYQKGFPAVSLRLIPQRIPTVKELGLSNVVIETVKKPKGLVLVSGPYNSGRTTTVFGLLEHINQTASKHILTLETPIEYLLVNNKSIISQREVGKDVPTFVQGLELAEDEDVEVLAVSQLTEPDQPEAILQAVASGKLVYVVMNGQTVISSLESFLSHFDSSKISWGREALAESLILATVQRLLPAVNGGLVLAYEIITATGSVVNNIKDGNFSQLHNVMSTSRQEGMITLDRHLVELVQTGKLTPEEAANAAQDPRVFQHMIK